MDAIAELLASPAAWAALLTLIVMEVVLGIDNLNSISWIISLKTPVFSLGIQGPPDANGIPTFETDFSWKDLILLAGGLFLMWKATTEIHHSVDADAPGEGDQLLDKKKVASITFTAAIVQILLLDVVFSVDSILTAVGMTEHVQIMYVAVIVAVAVMLAAADPLANFINRNPSVVMLALGFLLMIGMVLIGEAFGAHIPKGYIYTAMAFSAAVEGLNIWARTTRARKRAAASEAPAIEPGGDRV